MTQLSLGWPLLRHPLFWTTVAWLASMALLGVALAVLVAIPDKWDRAVVLGTCGGLPILQRQDGTIWLRVNSVRVYRVEDPDKITCG